MISNPNHFAGLHFWLTVVGNLVIQTELSSQYISKWEIISLTSFARARTSDYTLELGPFQKAAWKAHQNIKILQVIDSNWVGTKRKDIK